MQTLFSLEEKIENCWNSTEGMNYNLLCSEKIAYMFGHEIEVIIKMSEEI